jgi:hypothetical protein
VLGIVLCTGMLLSVALAGEGKVNPRWSRVNDLEVQKYLALEELEETKDLLESMNVPLWILDARPRPPIDKNQDMSKQTITATGIFDKKTAKNKVKIDRLVHKWNEVIQIAGLDVQLYDLGKGELAMVMNGPGQENADRCAEIVERFISSHKEIVKIRRGPPEDEYSQSPDSKDEL